MSNFVFLPETFRDIAESAKRAEGHIMGDPRAACFIPQPRQSGHGRMSVLVLKAINPTTI